MDCYQLRIHLCCALISDGLARKLIVKKMLLILYFLKVHQLLAYFWSSCPCTPPAGLDIEGFKVQC